MDFDARFQVVGIELDGFYESVQLEHLLGKLAFERRF
jgi:hypothetical protein